MAAKVITVFNQKKGGGCKTTIAMSQAGSFGLRNYAALVVDMDPQGTASRWSSAAPKERPFPASVMTLATMEDKMHRELRNHIDKFDVIVIDCPSARNSEPPRGGSLRRSAFGDARFRSRSDSAGAEPRRYVGSDISEETR